MGKHVKQIRLFGLPSLSSLLVLALVLALPGCAAHRSAAEPQRTPDVGNVPDERTDEAEPTLVADVPEDDVVFADLPTDLGNPDSEADESLVDELQAVDETVEDPALLAAEALEACESARMFWEQGDIEEALAALDHAYALLLEIPADNPEMTQSKEDLRHLISQRVVEIYRSRLTSATDLSASIPLELNAHVQREIKSFQGGERTFFMESYRRSGLHRPMIVRMLRDAGMPEELSWLPLVESGFKTRALSRARALGMWQFISSTGYRFGLNRNTWVDQRMDPEESTRAAIEYLTELHGMFGDWLTALAGYNCGENRVMSVIRRQQNGYLDHFWDLFEQLPRETARYVPRFLATLLIVGDPEAYGFELPEPLRPVAYETVNVARHVQLTELERALDLDKGTLAALNPELRRGVTPATAYGLNVPVAVAPTFNTKLAELPAYVPPQDTFVVHRVRRGETLSGIARRYRTSVNAIMRTNNLRSRNRIQQGQRLKIPQRGGTPRPSPTVATSGKARSLTHTVRRGDSLWKLASRYGTTVDRIKRDNSLRGDRLYVGQSLRINSGVPSGSRTYAVRRGDTIGKIAKAHRVSLNAVLRANGLSRSSTIYPGQVLVIPN
jgi:membrane-bound lytic murein transglycosylase D